MIICAPSSPMLSTDLRQANVVCLHVVIKYATNCNRRKNKRTAPAIIIMMITLLIIIIIIVIITIIVIFTQCYRVSVHKPVSYFVPEAQYYYYYYITSSSSSRYSSSIVYLLYTMFLFCSKHQTWILQTGPT
jgi:hypothetical protein